MKQPLLFKTGSYHVIPLSMVIKAFTMKILMEFLNHT